MKFQKIRNRYLINWLVSILIFILLIGLNAVDSVFAATYNFDQTDVLGEVKGTITINDGTFTNQAAADALNTSIYSITIISADGQNSFTLDQDNSTWSWNTEAGFLTVDLSADGTTLQLKLTIYIDSYWMTFDRLEIRADEPVDTCTTSNWYNQFSIGMIRDENDYTASVIRLAEGMAGPCSNFYGFYKRDLYEGTLPPPYSNEFVYNFPALTSAENIEVIKDSFEKFVEDGTLEGSGPGNSAEGRLGALRNMLQEAEYYINNGKIPEACQQLLTVYNRVDGDPQPPDFVEGEAAYSFMIIVDDLINSLECP